MNIFFAGDSTAQYNDATTFPQTGIAQCLDLFFNPAFIDDNDISSQNYMKKKVNIINLARNGRSTKSFITEGRLDYLQKHISKNDFLFVMFGHNDEKLNDVNRGTEAFGDFQENLIKFANVAFDANGFPLFITPVARRKFERTDKGTFIATATHGNYPHAMIEVAKKLNLPYIDLSTLSREYLTQIGPEKSKDLYMNLKKNIYDVYPEGKEDNTHLKPLGAYTFAKMIAQEILKINDKNYQKLKDALCFNKTIDYTECTNAD